MHFNNLGHHLSNYFFFFGIFKKICISAKNTSIHIIYKLMGNQRKKARPSGNRAKLNTKTLKEHLFAIHNINYSHENQFTKYV